MEQTLIKLSDMHYIIVNDNLDIEENCYCFKDGKINQVSFLMQDNGSKITHSTQPLGKSLFFTNAFDSELSLSVNGLHDAVIKNWSCKQLSLSEVEEVINGYSVEKMALEYVDSVRNKIDGFCYIDIQEGYQKGFNAHKKLVKDKLFTIEDMRKTYNHGIAVGNVDVKPDFNRYIQSLLPQTQWEVKFNEQGKLELV